MVDNPDRATVPSPEATGGAGYSFESRVAGIALARMLRGDRIEGLDLPVTRVRLQQRVGGAVLDDVVVDGVEPLGATRSIEYQVKRTLTPTPGNPDFKDVICRCSKELDTADADETLVEIAAGRRRFGLAAQRSEGLLDLRRVTIIARSQNNVTSFLQVCRDASRVGVRTRLEQLRSTVANVISSGEGTLAPAPAEAVVDERTWRIAQMLYIWQVDAEPSGTDVLGAQDRLGDLVVGDADPHLLLNMLIDFAQIMAPQAASIDLGMLRSAVEQAGFALNSTPAHRVAYELFRASSADALDLNQARLGNQLRLPRGPLRARVVDALDEHAAVLLSGRAGVGKSILGRLVAADLTDGGAIVLAISLVGRDGSLAALESDLRVRIPEALAGAPIGATRVLFIDGTEQALTDAGSLLTALLRAIPHTDASAPPWKVLLTARTEAADTVATIASNAGVEGLARVVVEELLDAEVDQVLEAFPALTPLGRNTRAKSLLLRRPYLIELLIRSTLVKALPPGVVGEEDLLDVVTSRLIRRDEGGLPGQGAPDARSDIYLKVAEAVIANQLPASLRDADPTARAGLRGDDVIAPVRLSWRFAHDVLVDYAVATRLLEPGGADLILSAVAPRRLLRGVRLWMQRRLAEGIANADLTAVWSGLENTAEALTAIDGTRWRDSNWEALLHVGASRGALAQLRERLVVEDGAGLVRLIDVAERLARRTVDVEQADVLALDTTLTGPVVDLLAQLGCDLPPRARLRAARLVHGHLRAAFALDKRADSGLVAADRLPDTLIAWAGDDEYGDVLEFCIGSLGFLGDYLGEHHDQFLVGHIVNRPDVVSEVVESRFASTSLARSRPELLLRLAGLYYIGVGLSVDGITDERGRRPRSLMDFDSLFDDSLGPELGHEGARDHDFKHSQHLSMWPLGNNQAHPALGPFAALLEAHPREGMVLIGAIVDAGTAARERLESGEPIDQSEPALVLTYGMPARSKAFFGPATVWNWHRRTSVGPGSAQSALMALREWASRRLSAGENPADVRNQLLDAGTSLAFPAVAWFILLEHLDLVTDELDPFLVHPQVWGFEIGRQTSESTGTALDVPEMTRLRWTVSDVAMQLVLRGDQERRQVLGGMGRELASKASERPTDGDSAVVLRWATELDISSYVAEPHPDGILISVAYSPEISDALAASGGAQAARAIQGARLMTKATGLRDKQIDLAEAVLVWAEVVDYVSDDEPETLYASADLLCAAAAGLLAAAASGHEVVDAALSEATAVLLEGASTVAETAPAELAEASEPESNDPNELAYVYPGRIVRDMYWDNGMDRSVATGLSLLVSDVGLRGRVQLDLHELAAGVVHVAAGPYDETRNRLVTGLMPLWDQPCDREDDLHSIAVSAARRLIATAGYGSLSLQSHGYAPATLSEPFEGIIASSDDLILELQSASYGVDLLAGGANSDCVHGVAARELLTALIEYDERVWPERYARHHFGRVDRWRHAIDLELARRILRGDRTALTRRLGAFVHVGEQLAGLLTALVTQATDAELAGQLHAVWSDVLDRLLPDVRNLEAEDNGRKRPYHRDVDELDAALLLVPPEGTKHWPWAETIGLAARWFVAFTARPDMADRAITFTGRTFGLRTDLAVTLCLQVLGTDVKTIMRESHLAVPWLQLILRDPPSEQSRARASLLLDRLAAGGDEFALNVQREFESG